MLVREGTMSFSIVLTAFVKQERKKVFLKFSDLQWE